MSLRLKPFSHQWEEKRPRTFLKLAVLSDDLLTEAAGTEEDDETLLGGCIVSSKYAPVTPSLAWEKSGISDPHWRGRKTRRPSRRGRKSRRPTRRGVEEHRGHRLIGSHIGEVGKSLLIKSLVEHYTRHNLSEVRGPITVASGKQRRVQFVECPNDRSGMIDAAKYADLVLLLIDGSFGFEMETFEFLNILQIHGFPLIMGVLTHLDKFINGQKLRKTKQRLKDRFRAEISHGSKLFYLSGLIHGKYPKRETHNLARFISVMKHHPLSWRSSHPYILVDRFEDVTPPERVSMNPKCERNITMYGYLRGCNMKQGSKVC